MLVMRILTAKLWILSLYCVCSQAAEETSGCLQARASEVKMFVISKRDKSGQYVSTVELHLGAENGRNAHKWTLNLNDYVEECDGTKFSQILIDTTARANKDYELFPGVGYYKFHTAAKTWMQAKKVCEDEGAHLVIINSEQELAVLRLLYQQNRNKIKDAHNGGVLGVGFHDIYVEGEYLTIFGEPLASTGFYRWSKIPSIQPDNNLASNSNPGEDCGSILAATDGLLNDIGCNNAHIAFVCEQELARPASVNNVCIK